MQKPPKFTGTVDLDDTEHHEAEPLEPEATAEHDYEHDLGPDEFADDSLEDFDLEAEEAARKRRAMRILYAGAVGGILLIGFVGYHQFAPLFKKSSSASSTPVVVKTAAAPSTMPPKAVATATANPPAAMGSSGNMLPQPPATQGSGGPAGANTGPVQLPSVGAPPASAVVTPAASSQTPGEIPGMAGMPPASTTPPAAGPAGSSAGQVAGGTATVPASIAGIGAPESEAKPNPVTTAAPALNDPAAAKPATPAATPQTAMPTVQEVAAPAAKPAAVPAPTTSPAVSAANNQPTVASPASQNKPATVASANGSDPRVDDLVSKVATLQASQKVTSSQLSQIQGSLDALQKQLGQVSVTPMTHASTVVTQAAPVARTHHHSAKPMVEQDVAAIAVPSTRHSSWILRSATPNGATLGRSSTGELQRVAVGDVVNGLGRITSIGERNGRWVVQGSNGRVEE